VCFLPRVVIWTLIAVGIVAGLGVMAMAGSIAFVFSIGTATTKLLIDATVYDRKTKAPVPGCLLAFEKGTLFLTSGEGQTSMRTDTGGRSRHEKDFSYTGSFMLEPFVRDRHPTFRFYLGEAPGYGTIAEVEAWDVALDFHEPFRKSVEVVPRITVQRVLAHEDMTDPPPGKKWQQAGFVPLPTGPPGRLLEARVRVAPQGYSIPLSVYLDAEQIAACQAPTRQELQQRAVQLYNSRRYEEALAAYHAAAGVIANRAWAHNGVGDCLLHLNRGKEAIAEHRQAAELAPQDPDIQYGYANSLISSADRDAVAQFQKLIALEPKAARGYIGLATALFNLERWRAAADAFEKAAQLCASCLVAEDRQLLREARASAGRR
jgi:hypothetical protein